MDARQFVAAFREDIATRRGDFSKDLVDLKSLRKGDIVCTADLVCHSQPFKMNTVALRPIYTIACCYRIAGVFKIFEIKTEEESGTPLYVFGSWETKDICVV